MHTMKMLSNKAMADKWPQIVECAHPSIEKGIHYAITEFNWAGHCRPKLFHSSVVGGHYWFCSWRVQQFINLTCYRFQRYSGTPVPWIFWNRELHQHYNVLFVSMCFAVNGKLHFKYCSTKKRILPDLWLGQRDACWLIIAQQFCCRT